MRGERRCYNLSIGVAAVAENNIDELFAHVVGFEWDESKRRANLQKHGIDFASATDVFADPKQFTYRSARHFAEQRYVSVGRMRELLIAVVSTPRNGKLRIISARIARRSERDRYDK